MAERESVGGRPGARTEAWRLLSEVLGDVQADAVCAWADLCSDPAEAIASALSVLRLSPGDAAGALNAHMANADVDAYVKAFASMTY